MPEISDALHKSFAEQGIDCRVGTRVDSVEVGENGVSLTLGNDREVKAWRLNPSCWQSV
jgi:pyruvate/2-oxoglutarate dehydrogenase complex dihydrolipoamide dehydrogenase (E3) component